jgi:dihydropyrimidinase
LVYHFGVASGRLPLERWVDVCCSAPARLMGLRTKGLVAPGYDADLVVFDPSQGKRISVDTLHEAADWTPYDGLEVTGWPRTVLLRGRVAVEDGDICSPGLGRFMERKLI